MARQGGRSKASARGRAGSGRGRRWVDVVRGFLFGSPVDDETSARLSEIKGLVLIGLSLWLLLSMVSYHTPFGEFGSEGANWGGRAGFWLANGALIAFGWAGYVLVALTLAWGVVILARKEVRWPGLRIFGGLTLLLSVAFLLQLAFGPAWDPAIDGVRPEELSARTPYGPGGWLALSSTHTLVDKFGGPGLVVLLTLTALISFMLATEMAFYPAIAAFGRWLTEQREARGESLPVAVGRWFATLARGLWDFLRGADLESEAVVTAAAPARTTSRRRRPTSAPPVTEDRAEGDDEEWEQDEDAGEFAEDGDEEEEGFEEEDEDDEDEHDEEEADDEEEDEDEAAQDEEEAEEEASEDEERPHEVRPAARRSLPSIGSGSNTALLEPPSPPPGPWTFPPIDLLEPPDPSAQTDAAFLERAASKLENALKSFRVEAEVVAAQVGPAVTMFELTVASGTRLNKVTQLSQEIAAALKAKSVRIVAPIPGKSTIGIEVPNAKRRVVRLRELIHQKAYDKKFMALPLFLGMDATGTPIVEDLARMPHLLIAGTTGSGKSVCINTILVSLLLTRTPHDVKMILVDPKMVELMAYSRVPHLMLPVVTDARQATNVLTWACEKMEGRYELFKDVGVRNIKGYNSLGEEELRKRLGDAFDEERTPRHVPYIVVVIDEMADLMLVSKKEAETAITRLAQKSRAVGIHVIVATQRPSTDVITGVLKGNLPTRIAFQVASKVDSRVILDQMGAEKLLGRGDMLYTPPQSSQIRRVQGALVEDEELQRVVEFVCEKAAPTFNQELIQTATGTAGPESLAGNKGPDDPMFDEAVRVVLKTRRGSASLLQRALSIGYTRASRLIDLMSEYGILGEHRGSKSREILMTLEDWEAQHGEQPAGQGVGDE